MFPSFIYFLHWHNREGTNDNVQEPGAEFGERSAVSYAEAARGEGHSDTVIIVFIAISENIRRMQIFCPGIR